MKTRQSDVSLRDFSEHDIPLLANYWFRSPSGFLEARGVDVSRLPSEEKFLQTHYAMCESRREENVSTMPALTVEYLGKPIGVHLVNSIIAGDRATFHAHIWDADLRGHGIAMYSYPKAFQVFFDRFSLQSLHFKTPVGNVSANRVHEKLGTHIVEVLELVGTILRDGTRANHRILTRFDLDVLLQKQLENS